MPEARLEDGGSGLAPASEGWFIVNARDAEWWTSQTFGAGTVFESDAALFPQFGLNIAVLEPGKPNCLYHSELNQQEAFLVLSGTCKLLVDGEERDLGPWDFFHCPGRHGARLRRRGRRAVRRPDGRRALEGRAAPLSEVRAGGEVRRERGRGHARLQAGIRAVRTRSSAGARLLGQAALGDVTVATDTSAAVEFLLASREPAIRYLARRDVLGEDVTVDRDAFFSGPLVRGLLRGQKRDGGFGVHPYQKWGGAHWRLVSLVELGIPADDERAHAAAETVLDWLTSDSHRSRIQVIDGLTRRCGSQEGNALAVCCRLGMAGDPRVELLARSLAEWQWPDGGWNCDKKATGRRSSFNESLPPMWGLHEYWLATGERWAKESADRTAELFLEHNLFRALETWEPIHPGWLVAHYPPYWHYEVPQALLILSRMGRLDDPRAAEGLDLLEGLRRADGLWHKGPAWWRPPGSSGSNVEVVDWGGRGPSEMTTLNALRILKAAGRLEV